MGLRPFTSLGRRKAMNQVISLLIGAIVIIVLVYDILTPPRSSDRVGA
jgi:hypothetical protein